MLSFIIKLAQQLCFYACLLLVLILYQEFLFFICLERRGVAACMYFLVVTVKIQKFYRLPIFRPPPPPPPPPPIQILITQRAVRILKMKRQAETPIAQLLVFYSCPNIPVQELQTLKLKYYCVPFISETDLLASHIQHFLTEQLLD